MQKIGNIVPGCKVQIIDNNNHWRTIGECADTPNAISAILRKEGLQWAWVRDFTGTRRAVEVR